MRLPAALDICSRHRRPWPARARPETDGGPEPSRAPLGLRRGVWALFALGLVTIVAGPVATAGAGPTVSASSGASTAGTLGPAGTDEWMAFFRDSEDNLVGLVSHSPASS